MTSFDLIITDVHMPRMDAFAFIPALRRLPHYADVPVLVVTSDISRRTKIELLEAGADDFLLKPLDTLELGQKLRRLLKTSALMANLGVVTAQRDAAQDSLAERNAELERLTMGLVAALEKANVLNDSDTGNHIRRVCRYAALLANAHGCSASYTEQVYHYAGLHDVGKVGIRDGILKKPGKLTPQEFDEMKGHTLLGYDLLKAAGLPAVALNIAVSHHERWDGTGYPHSLKGEDIPLEARLVAVVDVFDALVSKRCYKEGFELEGAVKILQDSAGSHLDPQLVHKFLSKMDDILKIRTTFSDEPLPLSGWG
jgi:putative two-component system response regulator